MNRGELNDLIKSDFYRHYAGHKPQLFWKKRNVALYCTVVYRKAHYYSMAKGLSNNLLAMYYRYKLNYLSRKYLFQIPYPVTIGKGFNLVHFGRVIVAPNVRIGNNCNMFTGVTIGSTVRGSKAGVPEIGDNVWIGPNVAIVGGVKIADNVLIAANSYVNFDVPKNSIVIGNPGHIYPSAHATDGYICQKYLEK